MNRDNIKKVLALCVDSICDGNDYDTALKYGLINEKRFNELLEMQILSPTFLQPVRSLEYVEDQCKKIVDQLEAENENEK